LESLANEIIELNSRAAKKWLAERTPNYPAFDEGPAIFGTLIEQEEEFAYSPDVEYGTVDSSLDGHKALFIEQHEFQCRVIKSWFADLRVNPTVDSAPIDTNRFLVEILEGHNLDVVLSETGAFVEMDRSHLRAVFGIAGATISSSAALVHGRAINDAFVKRDIFRMSEEGLLEIDALQVAQHAIFSSDRVRCSMNEGAGLAFEYEAPRYLEASWRSEFSSLTALLAPVAGILELYGGRVNVGYDQEIEVVRVSLALPIHESFIAAPKHELQRQVDRHNSFHLCHKEPDMERIEFPRQVVLDTGQTKTYIVSAAGAALLTDVARNQLRAVLSRADEYIRLLPELDVLSLNASGMAQDIKEKFESAQFDISMSGYRGERDAPPPRYRFVHEPFAWERAKATQQDFSPQEVKPRDTAFCLVDFTPQTFLEQRVYDVIGKLREQVEIVQLPCAHEQENEYMGGEDHENQVVVSMLEALEGAISDLGAGAHSERFKLQVIPCHDLFITDIGTHDTAFSLSVLNAQGDVVLTGEFSRASQKWKVKPVQHEQNEQITSLVELALERIPDDKLCFQSLSKELADLRLTLPEELIFKLIDAKMGISANELLCAPSVRSVMQQALENTDTVVTEGAGVFELSIDSPTVDRMAYGNIFSLFGDNPKEVTVFSVAKRLYEDGYQFFQPNQIFLQQYEREQWDA